MTLLRGTKYMKENGKGQGVFIVMKDGTGIIHHQTLVCVSACLIAISVDE